MLASIPALRLGRAVSNGVLNSSLIKGVGESAVAIFGDPVVPVGSVSNGYASTGNFGNGFYANFASNNTVPDDKPEDITGSQETWIAHSHAYVMAAGNAEAPYKLKIQVKAGSANLAVPVTIEFPGTSIASRNATTDATTGLLELGDLPLGVDAVIKVKRSGYGDFLEPFTVTGGGSKNYVVDYDNYIGVAVNNVPATLTVGSSPAATTATLVVRNYGSAQSNVAVSLSADNATLSSNSLTVPVAGATVGQYTEAQQTFTITPTTAGRPYTLRVRFQSGDNLQVITKEGLVN